MVVSLNSRLESSKEEGRRYPCGRSLLALAHTHHPLSAHAVFVCERERERERERARARARQSERREIGITIPYLHLHPTPSLDQQSERGGRGRERERERERESERERERERVVTKRQSGPASRREPRCICASHSTRCICAYVFVLHTTRFDQTYLCLTPLRTPLVFRVSRLEFQVSGFGFRVSGFGMAQDQKAR